MDHLINFYQHLPEKVSPVIFQTGNFSLKWYPFMYLVAFVVIYWLLKWRIRRGEASGLQIKNGKVEDLIFHFMTWAVVGTLLGGRLGYVLFYDLSYFWNYPMEILSPFDRWGNFTGIYGMSYHGGVVGILLVSFIFTRKNRISLGKWANFVIPAVPAGYFFGRIGNFMNGELYGRITERNWGMFFDSYLYLRHPSQLYEAFGEGIVLFVILWKIRNHPLVKDNLLLIYLAGYSTFRFIIEFWREPDEQLGLFGFLTMGQILSLIVIFLALGGYVVNKRKEKMV